LKLFLRKKSGMKNKWTKLVVFSGIVLVMAWVLARITGALQMYRIPTPSSEPTIKVGDIVFTSNLKTPTPGNTVAYKNEYSEPGVEYPKPGEIHLHRMVADEGDVLEMKGGVLFLNGKDFDADKNLMHEFISDNTAVQSLSNKEEMEQNGFLLNLSDTQCRLFLSSKQVAELKSKKIRLERVIFNDPIPEIRLFKWMNKDSVWAIDHFGPLKIPKGHFFVMGDNRHNSLDSRYVGFIKKENFRGTVLNK
jgi:signal peptidase I